MLVNFHTVANTTVQRFPLSDNSCKGARFDLYTIALSVILALGVFLRLYHYFDNRSLWTDEIYLNINLIRMNFWELATLPLEYQQKAPIGYLWIVRSFVLLFGKGEMALRLFPLVCGISALFVFIPVARHFLKPWAVLVALALLAFSWPAIYHTVEAKQYSAELLASIVALFLYIRYSKQQNKISSQIKWGVLGGSLLLFSYSVIFVLAGIAFVLCLKSLLKKNWKSLFLYLIPSSLWLFCLVLTYVFFLGKYKDSGWLVDFFENFDHAFMPFPVTSGSHLLWFARTFYLILHHPLGLLLNFSHEGRGYTTLETILRMPLVPIFIGVGGLISLFKKDKTTFAVLIFPVLLALLASALKLYPFKERLILFATPLFILIIARGFEVISKYLFTNKHHKTSFVLAFLLLAPLLWNTAREVVNPSFFYRKQYGRETFLRINKEFKEGDVVYLYWNTSYIYKYYKEAYGLKYEAIQGRDLKTLSSNRKEYVANQLADIKNLNGKKRLWYVYDEGMRNNIGDFVSRPKWYHEQDFIPGKLLEDVFSTYGKKTDQSIHDQAIRVNLFELTGK